MHELAITQSMLDIAVREGQKAGAQRITALNIKIGEYSDVVPALIQEYFDVISRGTIAAGAQLRLTRIPVTMRCHACGWQGRIDKFQVRCGRCGGTDLKLLTGREFYVESLEAE